jgi:hypothetical protein
VTVAVWDNDPLVPVTITVANPPDVNVHDSVEDPDPVTLEGDTAQAELLVERLTAPVKPFWAVTVIVEV